MTNTQLTMFDPMGSNPTVNPEAIPPELPLLERLEVMQRDYGFIPTTQDEVNVAIGLVAFQTAPGKTAKHLNEILKHQQGAQTTNPAQAVISVTAEYASFAHGAKGDLTQLSSLRGEVAELMNPKVSLIEELELATGGLRQLVRHMDLRKYIASKGHETPQFELLKKATRTRGPGSNRAIIDVYSSLDLDHEVEGHLQEVLTDTKVGTARSLVDMAVLDQTNRLNFWTERLREARAHAVARPIAYKALASLGALWQLWAL